MDKRLILFVLTLSVTLFGVNYYFQTQRDEEVRAWKAQQAVKKEQKINSFTKDIETKTAKAADLPLLDLYADAEGKEKIGLGLSDGTALLMQNGDKQAPALFARKAGSAEALKKYTLTEQKLPANLYVYDSAESPKAISIADLPDFGQFDLQLIDLNSSQVTWAEYNDGNVTIPAEEVAKINGKEDELANALVVSKIEGKYLPVGVYSREEKRVVWLEEIEGLKPLIITPEGKAAEKKPESQIETFYVLENGYQQLVFSNQGAALAEINLPFQSESHPSSVVKEIQFDRDMVEHHAQNAYFPSQSYYTPGADGKATPVKHDKGHLGGYYPLIRRDLIQDKGHKNIRVAPKFYALNIVSEYPEVADLFYEVVEFTPTKIVFQAKQSLRTITKTYSIAEESKGGPYCIDLTVKIEGDSRGLWLTSGVPEVEWISGAPAPVMKYRITRNQKGAVENVDLPQDATTISSINPDWVCNSNGFFGVILDPLNEATGGLRASFVSGTQVPSRLVEIDQQYDLYPAAKMPGYQIMLPLKNTAGTMQFRIFAGPFASSTLKQVDQTFSNAETGYNPDYIACQTFHGWFTFISEPFAKFLFLLMNFFYWLTHSWGFSIILLTVALRIMLYPLNAWSLKSTVGMQKIAPEVKAIQDKYKKEPQKAQAEIINLYRERGVNPLSGCLPLLIQMPFLIGMFDLLKSTFELRGASFIPGWIDDLSAPDVLFSWGYPIFFIGNQFHLLPILLAGVMFLQQRMMAPSNNANEMNDQQRQQRAMGNMMSIVFAFMFYSFPSGLNIYWLSSMLLGILQQWWTTRQMNKAASVPVVKKGK